MSKIKLSNTVSIDLQKLVDSRLLIQANSGGGKSWAIRRIVEQAFGKVQIIILDPEGEFTNLRTQFPFVYTGKGGDAPTESRSAALLAHRLLELKASAIVDLYEMPPQERKHFVRLFCEAMVNAPKELWHDCLIIIDEAHVFAPEKGESEAMGAVIDLATRGRKRGYCAVLATQRLPKLNKDAAAECNNKLIGRASQDIDRKRASEELGFTTKEQIISLRDLNPGEFYVFGPAISRDVIRVTIGDVKVKPPPRSQSKIAPPAPSDAVKKILGKLADLPAEAIQEAKTIAEYKQQVKTLTQQLKTQPVSKPLQEQGPMGVSQWMHYGAKYGYDKFFETKINQAAGKEWKKVVKKWVKYSDDLLWMIAHLGKTAEASTKPGTLPPNWLTPSNLEEATVSLEQQRVVGVNIGKDTNDNDVIVRGTRTGDYTVIADTTSVTPAKQKILDALAWYESINVKNPSATAVALLAGYAPNSGYFTNIKGSLRSSGLIDYPAAGLITFTLAGHSLAIVPQDTLTQDELHQKIKSMLTPAQIKILEPLLAAYPSDLSTDEVIEASGFAQSGYFTNVKGSMRSMGVITYPSAGRMKAADILFID